MRIVRGSMPHDEFTMMPNAAAQDVRLSRGARGLLTEIVSRPPGWSTNAETLASQGPEGVKLIKKYLGELRALGYLDRVRERTLTGRFEYTLYVNLYPEREAAATLFDDEP